MAVLQHTATRHTYIAINLSNLLATIIRGGSRPNSGWHSRALTVLDVLNSFMKKTENICTQCGTKLQHGHKNCKTASSHVVESVATTIQLLVFILNDIKQMFKITKTIRKSWIIRPTARRVCIARTMPMSSQDVCPSVCRLSVTR